MAYIHNLKILDDKNASVVLGSRVDSANGYAVDIGFMSDQVASLLAVIRGVDFDANFESLLDETEISHAESTDGLEFASVLSPTVVREIASIHTDQIASVATAWAGYEEELTWHEENPPEKALDVLLRMCRDALLQNKYIVVHSYE